MPMRPPSTLTPNPSAEPAVAKADETADETAVPVVLRRRSRPGREAACLLSSVAPPRVVRGIDRSRLAEIMASMAEGDAAAIIELFAEYRGPITAVVRLELRRRHVHPVEDEDLHGLVLDACLALAGCAAGWRSDGAMPWVWGRHRIAAVVDAWVGQFADSYDADRHGDAAEPPPQAFAGDDVPPLVVLDVLAVRDPLLALFRDALEQSGSERDRALFLAYVIQKQAGDPSPALTIGEPLGLRPDAVRQAVARVRRRLRAIVTSDDRFDVLVGLPLLD